MTERMSDELLAEIESRITLHTCNSAEAKLLLREATRARASEAALEKRVAELKELPGDVIEALRQLEKAAPDTLTCEDFSHSRKDYHKALERCPPEDRYRAAKAVASAVLVRAPAREGG